MSPLLVVDDLHVTYGRRRRGALNEVLHGVSFEVGAGETLGLVGESGSGKTTIGRAILGLVPADSGSVKYNGQDLAGLTARQRRERAKEIQVVFQDPYSSLNPAMTIEQILVEPLLASGQSAKSARVKVADLLDRVKLPADAAHRLPREFSGGQRQRIAIARALAPSPRLIVCDEPVSALDLTTQANVLDLMIEIQDRTGVAYVFISHDLAVVRHISHRIAVLYHGNIVELGDAAQVSKRPRHPYTRQLLLASPVADPHLQARRRAERHLLRKDENEEVGWQAVAAATRADGPTTT